MCLRKALRHVLSHGRQGLTLVETLVVIAILGVLASLFLGAVQQSRNAAGRVACAYNLRQVALAVHLYSDSRGHLPEGAGYPFLRYPSQVYQQIGVSWHTSILGYVEQEPLSILAMRVEEQDPQGISPIHGNVQEQVVKVFLCPLEPAQSANSSANGEAWGLTSYQGVAGTGRQHLDGLFHQNYTVKLTDISDGTSNTLMIGERPPGPGGIFSGWFSAWGLCCVGPTAQTLPAADGDWLSVDGLSDCTNTLGPLRPGRLNDPCDVNHFWSLHPGGANFAFADGAAHFLTYSASSILPALATRDGGEVVDLDF